MPRSTESPFIVACLVWALATAFGAAVTGLAAAGALVHAVVPCALMQCLVLLVWQRRLGWRWLIGTILFGVPGAVAGVFVGFTLGSSGLLPDAFAVGVGGLITGAAMGLGGSIALRSLGRPGAWSWIVVSAVAWAAGAGLARALTLAVDPHGMKLLVAAQDAGLGESLATWAVGARSAGLAALIAGVISAPAAVMLSHRSATDRNSATTTGVVGAD